MGRGVKGAGCDFSRMETRWRWLEVVMAVGSVKSESDGTWPRGFALP